MWRPEKRRLVAGTAGLLTLLLGGCGTVALRHSFNDYSAVYAETQNRQMLLNLARLQEREPIYFFQLAQISAGYTFTETASIGGLKTIGLTNATTNLHTANGSVGGTATHNPVFTLVPLGGDKFAQQLLAPIKPAIFYELYEEGWPIDLLMRVLIERIELVKTKSHPASGSGSETEPKDLAGTEAETGGGERLEIMVNDPLECQSGHYDRFLRACALARKLQETGILYLDISSKFEPLADGVFFKEPPTAEQLLSANKDGLVWRQVSQGAMNPGAAPLAKYAPEAEKVRTTDGRTGGTIEHPSVAQRFGNWQLGKNARQTLFRLNEEKYVELESDLANGRGLLGVHGFHQGNDDLMGKFHLVLKAGIGVTDTNSTKNEYKVRLVMRSLIGSMLALANEQRNFSYYRAFKDKVAHGGLNAEIERLRADIGPDSATETATGAVPQGLAEKRQQLAALINQGMDTVPEFEEHPVLILNWKDEAGYEQGGSNPTGPSVVELDYKDRHYAIADRGNAPRGKAETWNRDVFRLLVQLSLQASADPSTFALPSLLQSR